MSIEAVELRDVDVTNVILLDHLHVFLGRFESRMKNGGHLIPVVTFLAFRIQVPRVEKVAQHVQEVGPVLEVDFIDFLHFLSFLMFLL